MLVGEKAPVEGAVMSHQVKTELTCSQASQKRIFSAASGSKPGLLKTQLDLQRGLAQQANVSGTAGGPDAA